MAWQEELRALDADVAAGVLSTPEYRRRRDELLVGAADSAVPAGAATPEAPAGPFPPPFRWAESAPPRPRAAVDEAEPTRMIDRPRVHRAGPGLPPWLAPGALAQQPAPLRRDSDDVFDESPPWPYRAVTVVLTALVVLGLIVWFTWR